MAIAEAVGIWVWASLPEIKRYYGMFLSFFGFLVTRDIIRICFGLIARRNKVVSQIVPKNPLPWQCPSIIIIKVAARAVVSIHHDDHGD